jgi:poly-gamma-glutamate capsule biosynthesis protein CapA/YwtB (metallophosphatase superfamily)
MKNIPIIISIIIFSLQFLGNKFEKNGKEVGADSLRTVTISFVGDLMCHGPQMDFTHVNKDSFDFKPVFREVKKILSNSDLAIGNLETTIAGKENRYTGYPLFNSPDEYLDAVRDAGFDILFTSNNHSFDRGKKGVLRTLDKIQKFGMKSVGTNRSSEERDSIRIYEINGIKFSVLAYTYGLNGNYIPKDEKYLVNIIDTNFVKQDIINARTKGVEVILIYFHFGEEYQRKPNTYQKKIVESAINNGADIIIGSHPHVIQPIEYFHSTKNKVGDGIVAYSLGNFISNQRWRYSDCGVILNISISKNFKNDKFFLSNVSALPTWVLKCKTENKNEYIIIPSDSSTTSSVNHFISKSDREKMNQSFNDSKKMYKAVENHSEYNLNQKTN